MYLGAPILNAYMLASVISFSCTDFFYHYIVFFFMAFVLKSVLSDMSIAVPTLLLFPFT